ncbi:TRCF domain-containing protein, partial [Chloroflexota bacterium]
RVEQLEPLAQEFSDRFGALPSEVENLLYAVRIKILATGTGIESISAQRGEIVLSLFEGMRLEKQKVEQLQREGIKAGAFQIRLNLKRLGEGWREVLEEVLTKVI